MVSTELNVQSSEDKGIGTYTISTIPRFPNTRVLGVGSSILISNTNIII